MSMVRVAVAVSIGLAVAACSNRSGTAGASAGATAAGVLPGSTAMVTPGTTAATPNTAVPGSTATPGALANGAPGAPVTITLDPWQDSGVSGQVQLMGEGDSTQVISSLSHAKPGQHQGFLHQGSCQKMGKIVARLGAMHVGKDSTGSDTTTAKVKLSMLTDGNHFAAYHEAGGRPGKAVACKEIPKS